MKNINESGRSMVEMLGVLAIIGVLSIGGIAGYTMAMNKYRANEIVSAVVQGAIDCRIRNNISGDIVATGLTGLACVNQRNGGVEFKANIGGTYADNVARMVCKSLNITGSAAGSVTANFCNTVQATTTMYYQPQS